MLKRVAACAVALLLVATATLDMNAAQGRRLRARIRSGVAAAVGGGGCGTFTDTFTVDTPGWITEGVVIPQGEMPSGCGASVSSFTTQTDCQATWSADGSCRHALVTFNATSTGAKTVTAIVNPGGTYTPTWPAATMTFAISAGPGSGNTYTATSSTSTPSNCSMNGALARRCWELVTPVTGGSTPHVGIQVIFEKTCYAGSACRVGYAIQNIRGLSTTDKMTLTTTATLAGSAITTGDYSQKFAQTSWNLYTGQRWYRTKSEAGLTIGVMHQDFEPWFDASVIPRFAGASTNGKQYTDGITCPSITDFGGGYIWSGSACNYAGAYGFVGYNQFDSENFGRDELEPWADWDARYVLTGTDIYRQTSIANANQSGGWTNAVDVGGDGQTTPKLTTGANMTSMVTEFTGLGGGNGALGWTASACYWQGANIGGCSEHGLENVNNEHLPDSNTIPYLLTGEKFYLDQVRFQGAWAAALSYSPGGASNTFEPNPYVWPGFVVGRGLSGSLVPSTFGRELGRPLRMVSRAEWVVPDTYSTDRTYFAAIVNATLADVGTYMDYLATKGWDTAPYLGVGARPIAESAGEGSWGARRGNTITSTTLGNPTVLAVKGDDSTQCTVTEPTCNDHGLLTGDYVNISGVTTSGATALNGTHVGPVTRLSATSFSVPVNTTANTTSEGSYDYQTSQYFADWRNAITAWEVSWICYTGLRTCASNVWAFPDKMALKFIGFTTGCPNFSTEPGYYYNFYPAPGYIRGNNLAMFANCTAWAAGNDPTSGTSGALIHSQATYAAQTNPIFGSHRGNTGWGVLGTSTSPDEYYTPYAIPLLAHARRRGLTGAASAYTATVNSGQTALRVLNNGLLQRPGFYWDVP